MAEKIYSDAYNAYTNENFTNAIAISDDALKKYPQDHSLPNSYSSGHIPLAEQVMKELSGKN